MQSELTEFDVEELLHLAIDHIGQQRLTEALECLQRAATLDPRNGAVAYFTAVVYAQTGLMERALSTMQRAVELDPGMDIAHFQIGLLCFGADRQAQATEAWKPLDRLGEEHPLFLFKTGLQALGRDQFERARDFLERGIKRNSASAALNEQMRQFLQSIDDEGPAPSPADLGITVPRPPQQRPSASPAADALQRPDLKHHRLVNA